MRYWPLVRAVLEVAAVLACLFFPARRAVCVLG